MGDVEELDRRVLEARRMLALGRRELAEAALLDSVPLADGLGAHPTAVTVYSLLASCAQADERWSDAFRFCVHARDLAVGTGSIELAMGVSVNLTGLMVASGQQREAVATGRGLVELAREHGGGEPLATALQGLADVLRAVGDDEAADRYAEALELMAPDDMRGLVLTKLGEELFRQRRTAEGVARLTEAADVYLAVGTHGYAYRALLRLAALCRDHGMAEAGPAFTRAHDLALDLFSTVDAEHYAAVAERVAAIRADVDERFGAERVDESVAAATRSVVEAGQLMKEHRYADAELRLSVAEDALSSVEAYHEMPRVWFVQGELAHRRGDAPRSAALLDRAAELAAALGHAVGESSYLLYRCVHSDRSEPEQLERLVRTQALLPLAGADQLARGAAMLNNLLRMVCAEYGAHELAEAYQRRAVVLAEEHDRHLGSWLPLVAEAGRVRPGSAADAGIVERLRAFRAGADNPFERYVASRALGTRAFEAGRFTEETLADLRDACAAFEEMRRHKGETDTFSGYTKAGLPPYAEVAEVALRLGQVAEAFAALERIKSRTVLDALRAGPLPEDDGDPALAGEAVLWQELLDLLRDPGERSVDDVAARIDEVRAELRARWDAHPRLLAHRLAEPITAAELPALLASRGHAVLVELFVGRDGVYAFVVAGGTVTAHRLAGVDGLAELSRLLTDPAEVLDHPVYRALAGWLASTIGDRPAYLVPHDLLHRAPLHLVVDDDGPRPHAATHLLPSASLLRYLPARTPRADALVGADPLGNLPFARAEGEHAAARLGVPAAYGAEVTADWLADGLARLRSPFVHLACHAVFNASRPERSGLLLAHPSGGEDWLGPDRLAELNWTGAVVVLGACRSGAHRVRPGDELAGLGRALLAAGAAGIVVSWRPVGDLQSALLLTWLHDELAAGPVRTGAALSRAQNRMRAMTARDLATWAVGHRDGPLRTRLAAHAIAVAHAKAGDMDAFDQWQEHHHALVAGGPDPDEAAWLAEPARMTGPAYATRVFAEPGHWAWFSVLGA